MAGLSYGEAMRAFGGRLNGYGVSGMGLSLSESPAFNNCWSHLKPQAVGRAQDFDKAYNQAEATLRDAKRKIDGIQAALNGALQSMPNNYELRRISRDVQNSLVEINDLSSRLARAKNGMEAAISQVPSNSCALLDPYPTGATQTREAKEVGAEASSLASTINNVNDLVMRAIEEEQRKVREEQDRMAQIAAEQQAAQAAAAAEQARIAAEAQAAADAAAAMASAEAQARAAETQATTSVELARIQAEQDRIARQEEQAAADRALRLQLEQQRMASEQAMQDMLMQIELQRIEDERAAAATRREESAADKKFELLLKLAAAGMIGKEQAAQAISETAGIPYAPPAQSYGGAVYQGGAVPAGYQLIDDTTGLPVSPGAYATPSPYGSYPGAYAPPMGQQFAYQSMPAAPAPAPASAPPPVVAPVTVQAPAAPVVPGIQFSQSFNPGAELFGMGGMGAAAYTLPPGATVAPGYAIAKDEKGNYQVTAGDGRTFTMSAAQINQAGARVADPKTGVVFYSTPKEESALDTFGNLLNKVIAPAGLTAADAYLKSQGKQGLMAQQPPAQPASGGGGSLAPLALGALAIGGVVFAGIKLGKKK